MPTSIYKNSIKQRQGYYKRIRQGEFVEPITPFEYNYYFCWNFKKYCKRQKKEKIVNELNNLAKIVIPNCTSYNKRRVKKHPKKGRCFVCKDKACYQHHIIWLKNGGYDNGINRIMICENCHKEIHNWL